MEMAVYINLHCQTFLPKRDGFKSIMFENPVPSNVHTPQVMDDFITPLMSKAETSTDFSVKKIQQEIVNMVGPLSNA